MDLIHRVHKIIKDKHIIRKLLVIDFQKNNHQVHKNLDIISNIKLVIQIHRVSIVHPHHLLKRDNKIVR